MSQKYAWLPSRIFTPFLIVSTEDVLKSAYSIALGSYPFQSNQEHFCKSRNTFLRKSGKRLKTHSGAGSFNSWLGRVSFLPFLPPDQIRKKFVVL